MPHSKKLICSSVFALLLSGTFAGGAQAAGLVCECKDLNKCVLEKGREDVPFTYDQSNPGGYDAAEKSAMQQADEAAAQKGAAAQQKWEAAGLTCPQPCDPEPQIWTKHGQPFAGASNGGGEGRSVWKVSYICEKTPQKEDSSDTSGPVFNFGIGIGLGGGRHDDDRHGDRDRHDSKSDDKGGKTDKPAKSDNRDH